MLNTIITILYLLAVPLAVMLAARRWSWIDKVSPMTVLYLIGLAVANLIPADNGVFNVDASVNGLFSTIAVPLAIPLMLMTCNLRGWHVGQALKIFLSGLTAVLLASLAGFFLFRSHFDGDNTHFAQVCAVATGIYTGGIPNMGAISQAVRMDNETYLYITSYDLIVTGLYLLFVILFGKQFFRRLLPVKQSDSPATGIETATAAEEEPKPAAQRRSLKEMKGLLASVGLTLLIVAIAYGATMLIMGGELHMTLFILLLTTLSLGASFLPIVSSQHEGVPSQGNNVTTSFDLGLYCVYVFCLAIATSCDIRAMDISGSLPILYYLAFIVFGSLVLQIIFAKIIKIDGDNVMVCSVALINSPPFVPLVAALLQKRDLIITGITIGLLGYMLGNYLGIGLFHLLVAIG